MTLHLSKSYLATSQLHQRDSHLIVRPRPTMMPSLAATSIYIFGLTSFIAGVVTLSNPASAAAELGFPSICTPVARGNSLAAIGMGIYYTLAGYQENRKFFMLTVPMRFLTTVVFWNQGWKTPAMWEGSGALVTLGALILGSRTAERKRFYKGDNKDGE